MADAATVDGKVLGDTLGTGRRKASIARVRLRPGDGKVTINGRSPDEYFRNVQQRRAALAPLEHTGHTADVNVDIRVGGGGITGQADACKLGIARALLRFDTEQAEALRDSGMLTRDGRMKERKKYGLHGARRGTQFSKR
jgi:small subunit ribosomal protein S9